VKPISIQLYTLREQAATDFAGVLKFVAETGFKGVEPAGLHGMDPKEVAKIASDLGMVVSSSHAAMPTRENIQQVVDVEAALGNKRLVSGFGGEEMKTIDGCKAVAEKFQTAAELLKPHGMTFGFHNHWWEFFTVDGKRVYDILLAEAPDAFSELDVYWAAYGKDDPVKVIEQYKSRIPLLHIKDGSTREGDPHTAVGSGALDIPAIVAAADPNVLEWLIVELDTCATDMRQAVKQSYDYLTSNSLAHGNV